MNLSEPVDVAPRTLGTITCGAQTVKTGSVQVPSVSTLQLWRNVEASRWELRICRIVPERFAHADSFKGANYGLAGG